MSVKEIYNKWYESETLYNEEMDCMFVLKEMIDVRERRGSCDVCNIDDDLHYYQWLMYKLVRIFYHFCTKWVKNIL